MLQKKKIALFGGAFDPPHQGHADVVDHLLQKHDFDGVWVVPSFAHAFGKKSAAFEHRCQMLETLFQKNKKILVSKIEEELGKKPAYMIDTLRELIKKNPETEFVLIIGSDNSDRFSEWKEADQISKLVKIYTLPRGGTVGSPFPAVSSSEIRQKIAVGQSIENLVPESIARYIKENNLYS